MRLALLALLAAGCTNYVEQAKEQCRREHGGVDHVERDGDVVCKDGVEIDVPESVDDDKKKKKSDKSKTTAKKKSDKTDPKK